MLSQEKAKLEIEKLRKEIQRHNYRYYVLAAPVISDFEYDEMLKRLQELERTFPQFQSKDSPTQRVGSTLLDSFKRVEHTQPMLSLTNTYNEQEVYAFSQRIKKNTKEAFKYCIELKIDGVSYAVRYVNGELYRAVSRGNGVAGEDITEHIKQVRGIPKRLKEKIDIEVRGEVFMANETFARLNTEREEAGLEVFANPRNATAGTFRQLDTSQVRIRGISSFAYTLIDPQSKGIHTQTDTLEWLESMGFWVEKNHERVENVEAVIASWKKWIEKRHELNFDIDGLVIKVDELDLHKELGSTSHSPRWAIAIKFPAEQKETRLESVTWSVGRTGVITPVAHLSPVRLAGTTVRNANLHNIDNIIEKDIREKDIVMVEKAGEIIPQVISVLKERRTGEEKEITSPVSCPVCGGETGKTRPEEVALRCLNPICPAKTKRALETFASREAMNIEGLGERIVDQLVEQELVHDIADIYFLSEEQIIPLTRMGQKSANNLVNEIRRSKNRQLRHLITGLGIPGIGKKTAKELANAFKSLENIIKATEDELMSVDGIGTEMANAITRFFSNEKVQQIVQKLSQAGVNTEEEEKEKKGSALKGLKFVLTGELANMTRPQIKELIESHGGTVTGSVSKKTDYVICGENPGSKYNKAKSLNVKILDENEFFQMLEAQS